MLEVHVAVHRATDSAPVNFVEVTEQLADATELKIREPVLVVGRTLSPEQRRVER